MTRTAIILALALVLLAPAAPAQNTISLRATARINESAPLTLGDIADLSGPDAGSLAALPIAQREGPSAKPWLELDLAAVRAALTEAEFPLGRVALNGATCAVRLVKPAPEPVGPAPVDNPIRPNPAGPTIRDAITAQLVRFYGVPSADLRLTFRARGEAADTLDAPIAGRRIDLQPGAAESSTRIPVQIFIFEADRLVVNETVLVDAMIRRPVLIARRKIERRERITADDFLQTHQWTAAGDRPATAEAAADAQAAERIEAGDVVTTAHVEPPIVVKRGDVVSIHCLSGGFRIQVRARALEKGRDGDIISFRLEGARRDAATFNARMNGRGTAVMITDAGPHPQGN